MNSSRGPSRRRACCLRAIRSGLLLCATAGLVGAAQSAGQVTSVQFAVSEGGAATLSIPLQVPRGIGGMEPQLSLNYASGVGNGLLGLGWALQGPSAITRCPRNRVTDGQRGAVKFNADDRYCLDGQRLLLIDSAAPNAVNAPSQVSYGGPGTEYRTERESFSRIRAVGSFAAGVPLGFVVDTKAGLTLEFGNVDGANAPVHSGVILTSPTGLAVGAVTTINRWMLRRISDRTGSFVEFEYCKGEVLPNASAPVAGSATTCTQATGPGSNPIHYIRYTNRDGVVNGGFGVMFRYDARPDVIRVFHEGSVSRQTQRLTSIQTYINFAGPANPGRLVRSYDLYYEPLEQNGVSLRATSASRLASIQERGFDENGLPAASLPPVTFSNASDAVLGMYARQSHASTDTGVPPARRCGGVVSGMQSLICP